jgi:hypothetical protein
VLFSLVWLFALFGDVTAAHFLFPALPFFSLQRHDEGKEERRSCGRRPYIHGDTDEQ